MPRKKGVLTAKQIKEVETLAAVLTQAQISDYLGFSERTFRRRMWDDPDVMAAYTRGRARTISKVAKNLVARALAGDEKAQQFYLLSQGGWRITQKHEVTGAKGGPIRLEELTDDELEERLSQMKNRLAALQNVTTGTGDQSGTNGGPPG